jgi:hypothetical protein
MEFHKAFAVLYLTVIIMAAVFAVAVSIAIFTVGEQVMASEVVRSSSAYYASEAGIEDGVHRVTGGLAYPASYTIAVASSTALVTVASNGLERTVESEGDFSTDIRVLRAVLDPATVNPHFFYGIQVGDGGLAMSNNARVNGNVYSNGDITGSNGAAITGDATVAGGIAAVPSVEWASTSADHFFATASTNRDIGQSFTAPATGQLNRVSVYLGKIGSPTADITLRITQDDAGKPSTSDLASATIARTSVGITPSWIDVSFSSPTALTSGATYWIVLDYGGNSGTNYWNWRKDATDGYANNTGKYTGNWNAGSAVWTNAGGDLAFRAWIGGVNTKIEGLVIGDAAAGTARANLFVDTSVHGSSCPNAYCIVENPPRAEMPLSEGMIQDWRNAGVLGGICTPPQCDSSGNFTLGNGAAQSLGPIKIPGNLTLSNNAVLTVVGTIWVLGDIIISNGSTVKLSSGYGSLSGVIMGDDEIAVSNNCVFQGSGQAGSYIMLLSAKNAPLSTVINVDNTSVGVIYYASSGRINFSNNATAREATAYGINLSNNAVITYEAGLANAQFSSGPGGAFKVKSWRETE